MTNLFDRFFNRPHQKTARTAKERLQFVLVTDRSELSPEALRQMQAEILDVIRKYCRIDEEAVDMKLEARERSNYLVADIPLRKTNPNSDEEPGRIAFMMKTTEQGDTSASTVSDSSNNHADASAKTAKTAEASATSPTGTKTTPSDTDKDTDLDDKKPPAAAQPVTPETTETQPEAEKSDAEPSTTPGDDDNTASSTSDASSVP